MGNSIAHLFFVASVIPTVLILIGLVTYPIVLRLRYAGRGEGSRRDFRNSDLPQVTVVIACYNGAASLRKTLSSLVSSGYPPDRLHIVVVSDASTDDTDLVAKAFADQGVHLLRLEVRGGKTVAENAAIPRLTGDVVVCMDAGSTLGEHALQHLVAAFDAPDVGIASATDLVLRTQGASAGEDVFTRVEMWLRSLESEAGISVGASGCLYAMRRSLFREELPWVTRDFASVLHALAGGWRCVTIPEAVVALTATPSIRQELRRKRRTMVHGIQTLQANFALLNPLRYPRIALPLLCRKVCRWLLPPALLFSAAGSVGIACVYLGSLTALLSLSVLAALFAVGLFCTPRDRASRLRALALFAGTLCFAGVGAWVSVLTGKKIQYWRPTARTSLPT